MDKNKGLYQKYEVVKLTNPSKNMDCIVLEFDDPISRVGIKAFAEECAKQGYTNLSIDILNKLNKFSS